MTEYLQPLLTRLCDVVPEEIRWLWPGRIPYGKLTIVEGDPGTGKSTLTIDLAARLSSGRPLPGETLAEPPANVLLIGVEDGIGDTVRPRLDAASGDPERVIALGGFEDENARFRPFSLPRDIPALERIILENEIALVQIDPLTAFLTGAVDSHKDHDIRQALAPLATAAENTGAAIVVVRHLPKATPGRAVSAGIGSIGIIGVARSALLVANDPVDPSFRILAHVKNNLGPLAPSLSFSLYASGGKAPAIVWGEPTGLTADDLIAARAPSPASRGRKAVHNSVEQLAAWLKGGERTRTAILERASAAGMSESTLDRAARTLGVVRRSLGFGTEKCSMWSLPATSDHGSVCDGIGNSDGIGVSQRHAAPTPSPDAQPRHPQIASQVGGNGAVWPVPDGCERCESDARGTLPPKLT